MSLLTSAFKCLLLHKMTCRICYEPTHPLASVCGCTGTHAHVHIECVQKWIDVSNKHTCSNSNRYGTITWVSLFEHLATEIIVIETLCCLILTASVYSVKKKAPWKLYGAFYAAFLISNVPPLSLVPTDSYSLNILVPHMFNLAIALAFVVYHRKNILARNFDCNQI